MSDNETPSTIERQLPPPESIPTISTSSSNRFGYKMSASEYAATFRLDSRFLRVSKRPEEPIVKVLINFENIRTAIYDTLISSYMHWSELRDVISANANQIDQHITDGCKALSISAIYSLYNHLANVTQTHAPTLADRYKSRCQQNKYIELPSGLIALIQQFGITDSIECFGNCRFLHYWDKSNADTFGLPNTAKLDDGKLNGFIRELTRVGVELVIMPSRAPLRTPWDSLLVEGIDSQAYTATTTYPIHQYNLNIDIFLAIKFRTSDHYESCIIEYAPRIFPLGPNLTNEATADDSNLTTNQKRTIDPAAASSAIAYTRQDPFRPCNHFQYVHNEGLQFDDPTSNTEAPKLHIFGRGNQDCAMGIKSVARGVTPDEVAMFFTHLFRTKM